MLSIKWLFWVVLFDVKHVHSVLSLWNLKKRIVNVHF